LLEKLIKDDSQPKNTLNDNKVKRKLSSPILSSDSDNGLGEHGKNEEKKEPKGKF